MDKLQSVVACVQGFVVNQPIITCCIAAVAVFVVYYTLSRRRGDLHTTPGLFTVNKKASGAAEQAEFYTRIHESGGGTAEERKEQYADMVNSYYTLSTDFYEYGWGESFHFAHRYAHESHDASILRHEYYLAAQLGLKPGQKAIDLGCGVGGPARNIARFSGAQVTGINNNDYQVSRATAKTAVQGLSHLVKFVKGDFMHPPFGDGTFDAAYAIEATCHAPDRTGCFSEVFRMLKPGGVFAGYEWVTTDKFNAANPEHVSIKHGIEIGDGLPDITSGQSVIDSLKDAGFEVEEVRDLAESSPLPWYTPFVANYRSVEGIRSTPIGIALTHIFVTVLEFLRLAPAGTAQMHGHLITASKDLSAGGKLGIFTPMYFFKATKPLNGKPAAQASSKASNVLASPSRGRSVSRSRK